MRWPEAARWCCFEAHDLMASWPFRARVQGEEKLVQLREGLHRRIRRPGAGSVESFLRGIQLMHDQQRLAAAFLEGHGGDGPIGTAFLIGPGEARGRCHFEVGAEERDLS